VRQEEITARRYMKWSTLEAAFLHRIQQSLADFASSLVVGQ
jgi:hypothetical protein